MELGYASSVQDAFEKYLTTPEFYAKVERPKPTPEEGIGVIQNAGGVAVLAHPHQLKLENDALEAMVVRLKAAGLQGIEAYYSRHTPSRTGFICIWQKSTICCTPAALTITDQSSNRILHWALEFPTILAFVTKKFRNGCLRQSLQNVPLDILGDSYYNRQRF